MMYPSPRQINTFAIFIKEFLVQKGLLLHLKKGLSLPLGVETRRATPEVPTCYHDCGMTKFKTTGRSWTDA
jgi:hypothetical protein